MSMDNNDSYLHCPVKSSWDFKPSKLPQSYSLPSLYSPHCISNSNQHSQNEELSCPTPYPPIHYPAIKRRRRLTPEETKILSDVYERTQKPNSAIRGILASQLNMSSRAVQVWFQNRRAKSKKDSVTDAFQNNSVSGAVKSSSTPPPSAHSQSFPNQPLPTSSMTTALSHLITNFPTSKPFVNATSPQDSFSSIQDVVSSPLSSNDHAFQHENNASSVLGDAPSHSAFDFVSDKSSSERGKDKKMLLLNDVSPLHTFSAGFSSEKHPSCSSSMDSFPLNTYSIPTPTSTSMDDFPPLPEFSSNTQSPSQIHDDFLFNSTTSTSERMSFPMSAWNISSVNTDHSYKSSLPGYQTDLSSFFGNHPATSQEWDIQQSILLPSYSQNQFPILNTPSPLFNENEIL